MSTILMLIAAICFAIAALISLSDLEGWNPHTLLFVGLCAWAVAVLSRGADAFIERIKR